MMHVSVNSTVFSSLQFTNSTYRHVLEITPKSKTLTDLADKIASVTYELFNFL